MQMFCLYLTWTLGWSEKTKVTILKRLCVEKLHNTKLIYNTKSYINQIISLAAKITLNFKYLANSLQNWRKRIDKI